MPPVIATIVGVQGDVRAEGRAILAERSNQSRRYIEWGLQNRYVDLTTKLLLQQSDLTLTGFSGTSTTRAGSLSTNVDRGTLTTSPSAICGTGNQGHVGVFRVIGRVFAAPASGIASDVKARLSWQDGDGPFRSNPYTSSPVANDWGRVDLGLVTISQAKVGSQKWTGRIEAYSAAAGDTVDIDFIWLVPALEGYGKARAAYTYSPGSIVGRDEFTGITAGTALNTRTAPLGGTWATSGVATDFAAADAPGASDETESRSTAINEGGRRFAILGSTNYIDTEVGLSVYTTAAANDKFAVAVARFVDSNNHALVSLELGGGTTGQFAIAVVVAGVSTTLQSFTYTPSAGQWYGLRLITYASGRIIGSLLSNSGAVIAQLDAVHSSLATGGALATGKPGFADRSGGTIAATRYYDNFYLATPAAEPIALYAGQQAQIRFDSAIRQDGSGTYTGPMPSYLGDRHYLPCAGGPNRSSRVTVWAHRNDLETAAWNPITDVLELQEVWSPRYIAVPR